MKNKPNVIFLGPLEGFNSSKEILDGFANIINVEPNISSIAKHLVLVDVIIDASMKLKIDKDIIKKATNLKIISCATTGSSHIDSEYTKKRGIEVRTLKEDKDLIKNLTPAAELSWALLMNCARNLNHAINHVQNGNWDREKFPGIMIKGKTIGIIGCGRIGTWMSKYASAFGMNIIGFDPYIKQNETKIKLVNIDELAKKSDFISIHIHLDKSTTGIIDNKFLSKCKKGVILINTSRGEIINEIDLVENLEKKIVGAVGVDVLCNEPDISNSHLYKYSLNNSNVFITPHCGGYSPDAVKIVSARAAEKIKTFYK